MTVEAYVSQLAQRHGVVYRRTPFDEFAEVASRLVGDDLPPPDATEDLLIALSRAGVVDDQESNRLLIQHLRERA